MQAFLDKIVQMATEVGGKIILALVVFIVGKIIVNKLVGLLNKGKLLEKKDPSLKKFLVSFVRILLYVVLVVSIIGILGVPMASVVTVLASAGVAIGMSLQGALGNLAGGIMLMIFRPFNVGDFVTANGETGTVKDITMFYTVLNTLDNKHITIPNGALMNATVTNFSKEEKRRVDIDFNLGKGEDIEKITGIMQDVMAKYDKILKDPAPFAKLTGGTNESMTFTVRAWCLNADYWDVYLGLLADITTELGKAGVKAPGIRVVNDK